MSYTDGLYKGSMSHGEKILLSGLNRGVVILGDTRTLDYRS